MTTTGAPSIIEYETASGVIVHITPLSIFTIKAISSKAENEFPYPEAVNYELPLENAADPSIKLPAKENPAYRELCAEIDNQRYAWRNKAVLELACNYPAYADRASMIAEFRPRLEELRPFLEMSGDDWQEVLQHCVFTGKQDRQAVLLLAAQADDIPLTQAEVVDGIKFFRIDLPRKTARRMA